MSAGPLLERIANDPNDVEAYAVLADALAADGDPRGELIAIQREALLSGWTPRLRSAERDLIARHADALLGPLAPWVRHVPSRAGEIRRGPHFIGDLNPLAGPVAIEWRFGFFRSVAFGVDASWWPANELVRAIEALDEIDSARFVSGIAITGFAGGPGDFDAALDALARIRAPRLERVFVGDAVDSGEDGSVSPRYVGDPSPWLERRASIERLALSGGRIESRCTMPSLRELWLQSPALPATVRAIPSFAPAIEHLELFLGVPRALAVSVDDLADLFRSPFPRLSSLAIHAPHEPMIPMALAILASAPLLPRLRRLDVSGSFIGGSITALTSHHAVFAHLEEIDLRDCRIGARDMDALARRLPNVKR